MGNKKSLLNNKRINAAFWLLAYTLIFILIVISASLILKKANFVSIFVSGTSMQPTLNGGDGDSEISYDSSTVDYGTVNVSSNAINSIRRFDIITTYYPWDESDYKYGEYVEGQLPDGINPCYKIKRVLALPGETITCTQGIISISYKITADDKEEIKTVYYDENFVTDKKAGIYKLPYTRKFKVSTPKSTFNFTKTLGEKEYWVQGDHWGGSTDSRTKNKPIYYGNITGVLVSIDGVATIVNKNYCKNCNCYFERKSVCPNCGSPLLPRQDIINKIPGKVKYFY